MTPPNTQKLVHKYIGLLNYYHGIWAKHSHTLEPLNNVTSSKVKFKCTDVGDK